MDDLPQPPSPQMVIAMGTGGLACAAMSSNSGLRDLGAEKRRDTEEIGRMCSQESKEPRLFPLWELQGMQCPQSCRRVESILMMMMPGSPYPRRGENRNPSASYCIWRASCI